MKKVSHVRGHFPLSGDGALELQAREEVFMVVGICP